MITTSREKQDPLEVNTKTVCSLTLNGLAKIDF
ncbi:NB-ARC protein ['Nostoc azollae' 0708]|uniref:NB-ARC protein n=1 Tax=Nostoc azollae (strain 0708) TaxID=551115 RepID=D7DY46_NOSA0|nr:NB-ARC protein ['Nostoc azollae' 0708]